ERKRRPMIFRMRWALVLLASISFSASAARFTASLDRDTAIVGEAVTLTLRVEGNAPQDISTMPAIDGLQPASGFSSSINTSIPPEGASTVFTYSLLIAPIRAGDFVIPPFTAMVNGERFTSEPLKLKALTTDPSAPPADFGRQPAFLWPVPTKHELYV